MKIDRLLSITLQLINRPMITARELSERYEVTIRTIYRDIETLSAAGIPVVAYQGKKGGFCLMENYRVDRQLLSLNDMTSILIALKGLNSTYNSNAVDETIDKIESLVPADKKEHLQEQFESMIIDLSISGEAPEHNLKFKIVNEAIVKRSVLLIKYCNLLNEETIRSIEPMSLILKANIWYVFGYCRMKNDYRLFRLSRIRDPHAMAETFIRKNKVFNEAEFFSNSHRMPIHIELKFSPSARNKVEEFFSDSPKTVSDDGFITVTVEFPEDEWVYSTILSYGSDVEVIAPPHLRSIIKERLKNALALYIT
jgi:predicted DNA-binding transcriptional regulator YafY